MRVCYSWNWLGFTFTSFDWPVSRCSVFSLTSFLGQFKPKDTANPVIGARGQLEFVDEDRVEIVVNGSGGGHEEVRKAIKELKNVRFLALCNV